MDRYTKEAIINASRDFLDFNPASHLVRWVIFLLFCCVPQKTVAAVANYTDRQVGNIRDRFKNDDFPREGAKEEEDKKRMLGGIVYHGSPPLHTLYCRYGEGAGICSGQCSS